MERRTDLALETRESFPQNHVEVQGVLLEKKSCLNGKAKITTVKIKDEVGSKAMKKPMGTYVTIESTLMKEGLKEEREPLLLCICEQLEKMIHGLNKRNVLIIGLGNREVTSDSLGPKMADELFVTRHLKEEFGEKFLKENHYGCVSAVAPGVMAQTGIETSELLHGVIKQTNPDLVIVVDALAARSVSRLCTTVQITDTGIAPGAGVGNRRKELNEKSLGVPVVAIGVPTVVDAGTIIGDHLENVLQKQGYSEKEIDGFIQEILGEETKSVMVTPKDIDASIHQISKDLARVLNYCFQKRDKLNSMRIC